MLISFTSLYKDPQMSLGWDGGHRYYTYILLRKGANTERVESHFPELCEKNINFKYKQIGVSWSLFLQPLNKIHLFSDYDEDIFTKGSLNSIIILLTITFFILSIACINFINLTTATSLRRAKEVGIRKVVGARRREIIFQFITETVRNQTEILKSEFLTIPGVESVGASSSVLGQGFTMNGYFPEGLKEPIMMKKKLVIFLGLPQCWHCLLPDSDY